MERTLQQVKVPRIVQQALKLYANKQQQTLNDTYDEIFAWFLDYRQQHHFFFYLASAADGRYKSMWPKTYWVEKIKHQAQVDNIQVNRVVFTAIVLFLKDQNLFNEIHAINHSIKESPAHYEVCA